MNLYELTYLISPELKEEELKGVCENIDSLILENGKVIKSEAPKKITLFYPIQKKKEVFLATSDFESNKEQFEILKKEIEANKNILRFLLVKKQKSQRKPLRTQKAKEENTNRDSKVELKEIKEKVEEILDHPSAGSG